MKLPYPINTNVRLVSRYGYRTDPFGSGAKVWHNGIDFVGEDKNIVAVSDGVVAVSTILDKRYDKTLTWQWGNYVRIDTPTGHREYYCHLQTRYVKAGQKVKAGDILGIEGATGHVTGRHLHFEVRTNKGVTIDAAEYLGVKNEGGTYKVTEPIKMNYPKLYTKNGFEFENITDNFAIKYYDKSKRAANFKNYINGGFFSCYKDGDGNYFTLPVANLKCDIDDVPQAARKYLDKYIKNGKLEYECFGNQSTQFHNKAPSTLIVPKSGKPYIADLSSIPDNAEYAISGVPTVRNGDDVDYYNYVKKQGWDDSCMYGTYRHWLGVRDGEIWRISGRTYRPNYIYGMEFWKKIKEEQFDDIICIDGGGSYFKKLNRKIQSTAGSRQINNIITF